MNDNSMKTLKFIAQHGGKVALSELRKIDGFESRTIGALCSGTTPNCALVGNEIVLTSRGRENLGLAPAKPIPTNPTTPVEPKKTTPWEPPKEKLKSSGLGALFEDEPEEKKSEPQKPGIVTTVHTKSESKPNIAFIETNREIEIIEYAIENKKNVLLEGPTGCGKTLLIDEMAKAKGKTLHTVNCDVELDKTELIGHHEVIAGETKWVDGIIIIAMKNGDWIVFDEGNTARPEVMSTLHQALDYRRAITIKEHHNEVVKAHPEFRVFVTMNPNYQGTVEMNYAFRRRFQVCMKMEYLSVPRELELIEDRTGLDRNRAANLVKIGSDTRNMAKEGKLSQPVSTAHLLEFAEILKTNKFSAVECAKVTLNTTNDFGELEDILNVVKNYFG